MKAIAFTLDALFSLIIVGAGISVLLYFNFSSQTPYLFKYNEAGALMNQLSSSPILTLARNNNLSWTTLAAAGANESWDQVLNSSSNIAGNPAGPSRLFLSYVYNLPSNMVVANGTIVADYGMVYFASGNEIFALNPNTGNVLWAQGLPTSSNVVSDALYQGTIIVDTYSPAYGSILALNAYNGNLIWSTQFPFVHTFSGSTFAWPSTPIKVYKNEALIGLTYPFGYGYYIQSYNLGNGTTSWSYTDQSPVTSLAIANGSVVSYNGYSINLITDIDNTNGQQLLWDLPASVSTDVVGYANVIAFGTTSGTAEIVADNGMVIGTKAVGPKIYGVSAYNGSIFFQDTYNVSAFNIYSTMKWRSLAGNYAAPIAAYANATPVSSYSNVYSLWYDAPLAEEYLAEQSANTGHVEYATPIPFLSHKSPYMAIAYGKLFVPSTNSILAFGSCNINPGTSTLTALATMYVNNMYGCANYVLSQIRSNANYSFYVGNYNEPIPVAQFYGAHALLPQITQEAGTNAITYATWFRYGTLPSSQSAVFGDSEGSSRNGYDLYVSSATNELVAERFSGGSPTQAVDSNALTANTWYFAAISYNGAALNLYLNGTLQASTPTASPISVTSQMSIGAISGSIQSGDFQESDFQIYNTNLTASQISGLYQGGPFGPPLSSPRPIGWYPLLGDVNNYGTNASLIGFPFSVTYGSVSAVASSLNSSTSVSTSSVSLSIQNYTTGRYRVYNVGVYTWH